MSAPKCPARQYGDQMVCECGNVWDTNDLSPPECPRNVAAERDRRADLFPKLLDALKAATCTIELEYGRDSCPTYRALIAKAEVQS